MERCTERSLGRCGELRKGCSNVIALSRLAAYEETGLTPEKIQAREEDIKLLQRQNKEFREEIYRLREEVNFWKSNSIQDKSKLGEIRILTKLQECERCPRERTDCCKEC